MESKIPGASLTVRRSYTDMQLILNRRASPPYVDTPSFSNPY